MVDMIPSPIHALHFPTLGLVGIALVLIQVVSGKAHFGFPGVSPFERKVQPVSYWLVIAAYTSVVLTISYLEMRYGP
jgi:hypothetical protein